MARKWLDLPWIQFKDWALGKLTSGGSSADFECPDEIPPLLALKNESGSSRKMVPACLTCEEDADGNLALCVMAQIKAGAVTVGAVTGPIATGVAPGTNAPVYMAGLDTNATPKVQPIKVEDGDGAVYVQEITTPPILGAGTAEIGKLAAGTAEIGKVHNMISDSSSFIDDQMFVLQTTTGVNANGVGTTITLPVPCSKFVLQCVRTAGSSASSIALQGDVDMTTGQVIIAAADQGAALVARVVDVPCMAVRYHVATIGSGNTFTINVLAMR